MNHIIVSIIIPVFNRANYIKRCLESIWRNSFEDYEIILINDGSTEAGVSQCDLFACEDSRIRVIHNMNMGVSAARNLGMKFASGKYIMFSDADDVVSSDWIETLLQAIERYPESLPSCEYATVDDEGNQSQRSISGINCEVLLGEEGYYLLWKYNMSGSCWNKIYITAAIKKHSLAFDTKYTNGEDACFVTDYIAATKYPVLYIPKCCYFWMDNGGNTVSRRYYHHYYDVQKRTYWARKRLIPPQKMQDFYNKQFYYIYHSGLMPSMEEKDWSYVKTILHDDAFKDALNHADAGTVSGKLRFLLRVGNIGLLRYMLYKNR